MQMPEAKSEMRAEFWSGSETYLVDDPGDCHERWLACKTPCRQYTSLELDLPLSNERIRQDVLSKLGRIEQVILSTPTSRRFGISITTTASARLVLVRWSAACARWCADDIA